MANSKNKAKTLAATHDASPHLQVPCSNGPANRTVRSLDSVQAKLEGGPDAFLVSRQSGSDLSRECLASLYKLASTMHSRQLTYHSKSLETSRARHVTLEQIWGQMSMLLPPVFNRLRENVRWAQKRYGSTNEVEATPKGRTNGADEGRGKGGKKASEEGAKGGEIRDDDENGADRDDERGDGSSAHTSQLNESDLDDEIAELLAQQRKARDRKKRNARDESWRYVFGKGNEEDDEEDGEGGDEVKDSEGDDYDDREITGARNRRGHSGGVTASKGLFDDDEGGDDDEKQRLAQEELEALKEMYGEDFVPDEEDDEGGFGDGDSLLEGDMKWDDPSALFSGEDGPSGVQRRGRYDKDEDILEGEEHQPGVAEEEEDDAALNDPNLTELQRERLRERRLVEKLEQERLYSTQWAMTGEVSGSNRPRDALLDEALDFEYGMKAVPVITEVFTAKLEDRIRKRILDSNYDDVQRRTALSTPGDLVTSSRRDDAAVKDSEKSRMSLMDLYEKEYLERVRRAEESAIGGGAAQSAEPLTEIEKDELRAIHMWRRLAQHLDALSNFHYTPKPVQEDLAARVRAVDGQAPAITFETVGNFATTRENALAPQDLYRGSDRKFADVGANELQPHERRALRRAKKEHVSTSKAIKEKHKERVKRAKEQLQKAAA